MYINTDGNIILQNVARTNYLCSKHTDCPSYLALVLLPAKFIILDLLLFQFLLIFTQLSLQTTALSTRNMSLSISRAAARYALLVKT